MFRVESRLSFLQVWGNPLSLRVAVVSGFVVFPSSKNNDIMRIISTINVSGGVGGKSIRTNRNDILWNDILCRRFGYVYYCYVIFGSRLLFVATLNVVDPGLETMSRGGGDRSIQECYY